MIALQGVDLVAFLLVLARISAFVIVAPPLNNRSIPPMVKAIMSAALALLMAPSQKTLIPDISFGPLASALLINIAVGLAMGFVVFMLFSAVQSAGHLIDVFGGFALTFGYDPMSASQQSVFGRFYQLLALTLFIVTPAHAITLAGLNRSFTALPIDGSLNLAAVGSTVAESISMMFLAALQMAAPLIGVLVVADIGLGLLTRVAPALNAFSLGFPLKMMVVLVLVGTTFSVFPETVTHLGERGTLLFLDMVGGG